MSADVTIVIDGDASGLVSAAQTGAAAMRPLSRSLDTVNASSRGLTTTTKGLSASVKDVSSLLKLATPAAGEMGEKLGGALNVIKGGITPAVAFGAGLSAVALAAAALASHAFASAANVKQLRQELGYIPKGSGIEVALENLEDLNAEMVRAADEWVVFTTLVDGWSAPGLARMTDWTADFLVGLNYIIDRQGTLQRMTANLAGADRGALTVKLGAGPADPNGIGAREMRAREQAMAAESGKDGPVAKAAKEEAGAFADAWAKGFDQWMSDYDAAQAWVLADLKERRQADYDAAQERKELGAEENRANAARAKERIALEKAAAAERVAIERQVAAANIGIASDYVGAVGGLIGTLAEASGASAEEIWQINHTAAMAQALLAIPLAALQGLSSGGPAAPALAAAYAGLAAIEFAAVAAQQPPSFHTGGLAPDEFHGGGYIGRTNEAQIGPAVLTAQGLEAMFGGSRGLAELNAGRAPEPAPIYLVVDGEPRRSRPFAGPTPGYGRTPFGGR